MHPDCTPWEELLADPLPATWPLALDAPAGRNPEQACQLAASFALAEGDVQKALRAATACLDSSAGGPAQFRAQLVLAQAELQAGHTVQAEARADWLSRHASEPWKGWGLFTQSHCALAAGDTAEAVRLFKLCTRLGSHEAAAPAFLELGRLHEARSLPEQAMRYLTLYRETFPRGLLPEFQSAPRASARADQAAGLAYAVQVGVFGDHANAEKQLQRVREAGFKAELKTKTVAGQKYTAVWAGRYRSQNEAQAAKRELEARFAETYRIVVWE
jgi:hypothetical protein